MVMYRNYKAITRMGYVFDFKKGQPQEVPERVVDDLMAMGAAPVQPEGSLEKPDPIAPSPVPKAGAPARHNKLVEVCKALAKMNDREDFTAAGVPRVGRVKDLAGFSVDKNEVFEAWQEVRQEIRNQ
jgi:hypothetical protein